MHVVPKPSFEITLQKSEIELEQQYQTLLFWKDKIILLRFAKTSHFYASTAKIQNIFLLLSNDFTEW